MNEQGAPLFEIRDLCKYFTLDSKNTLKAVNHVSLTIRKGETVGIVLQKNVLFTGTILDNLRWGKEDATE